MDHKHALHNAVELAKETASAGNLKTGEEVAIFVEVVYNKLKELEVDALKFVPKGS